MITRENLKDYCRGKFELANINGYDGYVEDLINCMEYLDEKADYVYLQIYAPDLIGLIVNGQQQFLASDYVKLIKLISVYCAGWNHGKEE